MELIQVSVLFPVSPVCVTLSTTWRGCWRRCLSIASLTEQCRYATSLRWNKFPPLNLISYLASHWYVQRSDVGYMEWKKQNVYLYHHKEVSPTMSPSLFRTVPTTGALQHGWPITSTTRCTHRPVSTHAHTLNTHISQLELLFNIPHVNCVLLQYTGSNKSDWPSSYSW